ncbi:hypothetical protein CLG96_06615 [Sphingomonas oleivorans]|uniref:Uncharacterized protein n=1 Tax=Sphingomonas oleivorans TaxID=1735121 RepID=A0A2T5FZV0_9SPHN|nr:hypothetical protein CLG96_06615 [Sphingomonas oleivorans]
MFPAPSKLADRLRTEIWVEKPVVAPQSLRNRTARQSPDGASALPTMLFRQVSEQAAALDAAREIRTIRRNGFIVLA